MYPHRSQVPERGRDKNWQTFTKYRQTITRNPCFDNPLSVLTLNWHFDIFLYRKTFAGMNYVYKREYGSH